VIGRTDGSARPVEDHDMNVTATRLTTPSIDAIVPGRALAPTSTPADRRPGRLRSALVRLVRPFRGVGPHHAPTDPGAGVHVPPQQHRVDLQTRFHVH
jgi:hypothetical protein